MKGPNSPLAKLLFRWSSQQESALHQMSQSKNRGQRLAGFRKSERVDAKLFLLAIVPFLPLAVSDQIEWERATLWQVWFWISVAWAVAIVGFGFVSYWRAMRRR